jgi:hypothetical protein
VARYIWRFSRGKRKLLDILEEADAEGISLFLRLRSIDVVVGEMASTIA